MRIIITAGELIDKGVWADFCELFGIDVYAVDEGLIGLDEEFILSEKEQDEVGL